MSPPLAGKTSEGFSSLCLELLRTEPEVEPGRLASKLRATCAPERAENQLAFLSRHRLDQLFLRAVRELHPDYPIWRDHPYEYTEGLLPVDDLRAAAGLRIGFVCTGNTCRSPMAETLARAILRERLGTGDLASFGFEVRSAGVYAGAGAGASAHAVTAMDERASSVRFKITRSGTGDGANGTYS